MKGNLGEDCGKGGLLSFYGKIGTIANDFFGKMIAYQDFILCFDCKIIVDRNIVR